MNLDPVAQEQNMSLSGRALGPGEKICGITSRSIGRQMASAVLASLSFSLGIIIRAVVVDGKDEKTKQSILHRRWRRSF